MKTKKVWEKQMKLKIGSKSGLYYFGNENIRNWNCWFYDPNKYFKDGTRHTAISILNNTKIPIEDRLHCVLRYELVSEKLIRAFTIWCARQVESLIVGRYSIIALEIAEQFVNGKVSLSEMEKMKNVLDVISYAVKVNGDPHLAEAAIRMYAVQAAITSAQLTKDTNLMQRVDNLIKMITAESNLRILERNGPFPFFKGGNCAY